jgi:predicted nucleotide-binding protein
MVSAEQLNAELTDRLAQGQELLDQPINDEASLEAGRDAYQTWLEYNEALLRRSFDSPKLATDYAWSPGIGVGSDVPLATRRRFLTQDISENMRRLGSLKDRLGLLHIHPDATTPAAPPPDSSVVGEDVFIVHGHDGEAKVTVARFLEKLVGRQPIILHEQADRGRTIIEKFEHHAAQAACAIVLLTADDTGGPKGGGQQPRARQNVVLELGFFLGKLGRDRVVILYELGVELPGDLQGVLYTALDGPGAWRNAVARELEAAGLQIDPRALLS